MPSVIVTLPDGRKQRITAETTEAVHAAADQVIADATGGPQSAPADTVVHGGDNPRMEHPAEPIGSASVTSEGVPLGPYSPAEADAIGTTAEAFARGARDRVLNYRDAAMRGIRTTVEPPDQALAANTEAAVEDLKRQRAQAKAVDEAPPGAMVRGGYAVGGLVPDAIGGAAGAMGKGIVRRIAGGTLAGGAAGVANAPFDDKLSGDFLPGAGLGMLFSVGAEVPNMIRNAAGRAIIKAYDKQGIDASVPDIMRPTQDSRLAEIDIFPDEATANATLKRAQGRISEDYGSPKYTALRKRSDQIVASFTKTAEALGASEASAPLVLSRASQMYDDTAKAIRNNAQTAFNDALAPAVPLAGAKIDAKTGIITGGRAVVGVPRFARVLSLQLRRAAEMGATPGELSYYTNILNHVSENGGRMRLGELQENLHQYGAGSVAPGTTATAEGNAARFVDNKQLFSALMDDMGDTAAHVPPDYFTTGDVRSRYEVPGQPAAPAQRPAGPALPPGRVMVEKGAGEYIPKDQPGPSAQFAGNDIEGVSNVRGATAQKVAESLVKARDAYKVNIQPLNDLQKQAIDKLLGSDHLLGQADFAKKFREMNIDSQRAVFALLDGRRPELADKLRGVLFLDAVRDAKTRRVPDSVEMPQGISETVDIDRLVANLSKDPNKLALLMPKGTSVDVAKRVKAGLDVLGRLSAANREGGGGQSQSFLYSVATGVQNIVSRNPIFLSKWLTGEIGPHVLERWLYTPEGIRALLKVAEVQPGRGAISASARAAFTDLFRQASEAEADRNAIIEKYKQQQAYEQATTGAAQEARDRATVGGLQ